MGNSKLGRYFRKEICDYLKKVITDEQYVFEGSIGQGNWSKVPWVAIFDRFITNTVQEGFYIVYLFKSDFSGVFISLNQGVSKIKRIYKTTSNKILKMKACDFRSQIGYLPNNILTSMIDLNVLERKSISYLYQYGSIIAKFYPKSAIPEENVLIEDLLYFINIYKKLVKNQITIASQYICENEEEYYENLDIIHQHKMYERNQKLIKEVKRIHQYKCEACGFSFNEKYKDIGQNFIEAHHLTPISRLGNIKIKLDPKTDFVVLCSNCHRMIHRTPYIDNIEEFRKKYLLEFK